MNMYLELKKQHQKEVSEFPTIFAFTKEKLIEGMAKLGLKEHETNKLLSLGHGTFIRKSDKEKFNQMFNRYEGELKKAINEDLTGEGFIYQMFNYELANHEYCITYELDDTLDALGFTIDEINKNDKLLHGLRKAIENQKSYF
ncbi:Uncharacterised protein [[Clostridium] sordellii]|uniref:DUF7659 family protein n=1 Tax=Paraclostridium sordellii TaxID=1505 RepID=UPI0005E5F81F|nr:hypothetical protein [Paeniclostridium sordellii]CEN25242.1 Uncharacterised protein [[Clostridium] sordellii] [Paeniclostridium sordellii]